MKFINRFNNDKAHYDEIGMYIFMDAYDKDPFINMLESGIDYTNYDSFYPYLHEFRHWVDHIGTIWGQDYLLEIIRKCKSKLNGLEFETSEISPYRIHDLLKANGWLTHIKHSVITTDSEVWKVRFSVKIVNDVPFFICHVLDYKGDLICNHPVTYWSLFECNARYEEIQCYLDVSNLFLTEEQRLIENFRVHREYAEMAYDSSLIEYSLATMIPSTIFQIPTTINAYAVSSTLNTVILNLTPAMLRQISQIDLIGEMPHHNLLVINRDFGYLLFYFCRAYLPKYNQDGRFILSHFLEYFNLPKEDTFEKLVLQEMEQNKYFLEDSDSFKGFLVGNIIIGQEILKARGIDSKKMSLAQFLYEYKWRPNILFRDELWELSKIEDLIGKPLDQLSRYEWWELSRYFNT